MANLPHLSSVSARRTEKLPQSLGRPGEPLKMRHEPGLRTCPSGFFKFLSTGFHGHARIALTHGPSNVIQNCHADGGQKWTSSASLKLAIFGVTTGPTSSGPACARMREVSKMSFSCEERRLGWLSELLERASEEVTKDRTSGVRTFLVQFRTNSAALAENSPSEKARILREIASQIQNGVRSGRISDGSGAPIGDWNWA